MVWANYMSPCNSIAGLYFKGACDVISVTRQRTRSTKAASKFQFLYIIWETNLVTYHFYFFVGKFPKYGKFSDSMEKNLSIRIKYI